MALTASQLDSIYQNVLFRPAEPAAIAFYANRTDVSDAQIRQQIELSQEAVVFTNPVVRLFETAFNRLPTASDLRFYGLELKQSGFTTQDVAAQLTASTEFTARLTGGVVTADFVQTVYQDLLNRSATASEVSYYLARSAAQLVNGVANSPEAVQAQAANVITFVDSVALGSPNRGDLDSQTGPVVTTTLTLTTGADNIVGTSGNDVINGVSGLTAPAATDTLTAADVINGGAGTDVLNITTLGTNANVTQGATISNVEVVQIRATNAGTTSTLNAQSVQGATFFNSNVSAGNVAVTNAAAGSTFALIGDGVTTTGNLTGAYDAASGATVAAVTLANGTKGGAVNVASGNLATLATLSLNSAGASNAIDSLTVSTATKAVNIGAATNLDLGTGIIGVAAGTTETISGAATSVKLGAVTANVASINASGLTAGGVTAAINNGVVSTFTLTGGQGADTVSVGGNFTNNLAAGSINGGAGTDVINVTTLVTGAATGAAFTGFESLRNSVTGQQDASLFGSSITTVSTNATGAGFSNLTAAQAANVQILATDANATFALANSAGTSDVLGLTLQNDTTVNTASTAATVINATGLTVTGFETLNVAAASGLQSIYSSGTTLGTIDSVSFAGGGAANLKAIAVSGAYAANVDATNALALTSLDASANTAGVVLTTGAVTGNLTVTGSAAADVLNIGTPNGGSIVAVNAGAGNDVIKLAAAAIGVATTINGGAGTDTIEFTNDGFSSGDNIFRGVSNVEKIVFDSTTTLNFVVGGNASNIAAANGGVLDVTATALTGASTVDASGLTGSNALKLVLSNTGANDADITVTSSVGGADNITISNAAGVGKIIVNGANNTAGITLDTTGVVSANATVANNTITTGSGNDSIKIGTFGAVISTGTGSDTVTLTAADAAVQSFTLTASGVSSTTNITSITNFGTAATTGDILNFPGTLTGGNILSSVQLGNGFSVTAGGVATKSGAALTDFVAAVAASTTVGVVEFQLNGDTYVGYSDGSSSSTGNDHIVKLVGVTGVNLTAATDATTPGGTAGIHFV